jgi:hypothetical protein
MKKFYRFLEYLKGVVISIATLGAQSSLPIDEQRRRDKCRRLIFGLPFAFTIGLRDFVLPAVITYIIGFTYWLLVVKSLYERGSEYEEEWCKEFIHIALFAIAVTVMLNKGNPQFFGVMGLSCIHGFVVGRAWKQRIMKPSIVGNNLRAGRD